MKTFEQWPWWLQDLLMLPVVAGVVIGWLHPVKFLPKTKTSRAIQGVLVAYAFVFATLVLAPPLIASAIIGIVAIGMGLAFMLKRQASKRL